MSKTGWNRKLGTSKREQGIITPKSPRYKKTKDGKLKCHCLFRGNELFSADWRCEIHNMAVKLVTPEEVAQTTTQPEAPKVTTPEVAPVEQPQPVEQASAQPTQQPQPYQGFVEKVQTAEDVAVSLS